MGLRDLLGPASVPDPADHKGPAVVEDAHAEHPHRHPRQVDAFVAPPRDAPVEQQHGGPGVPRAVPVVSAGALSTKPHPALRWACGVVNVPDSGVVVQVLGQDLYRRATVLANTGTNTVWIAPTREQAQENACFPIAAGASYSHDCAGAIYATAATGGSTLAFAMTGDAADQ